MTSTSFLQELFKERELRRFQASQQELEIGKHSLIFKKKCNAGIHSLLFCRQFLSGQQEIASQNEKKILEQQKQKYLEYVRKSFKEKIPEDFESENKLKKALKQKIREKKQSEGGRKQQQVLKRARGAVGQGLNDKKKVQKQEGGKKKVKRGQDVGQRKKIVDNQELNEVYEDGLQSEISLDNDEVEESYENDYDE